MNATSRKPLGRFETVKDGQVIEIGWLSDGKIWFMPEMKPSPDAVVTIAVEAVDPMPEWITRVSRDSTT